jgi:hypothetical protein
MVQREGPAAKAKNFASFQLIILLITVGAALLAGIVAFLGTPPVGLKRLTRLPLMIGAGVGLAAYFMLFLAGWRSKDRAQVAVDLFSWALAGLVVGWAGAVTYYTLINPPTLPTLDLPRP